MGCVHVIGAGLSGLSAAVSLACRGKRVLIHEASGHAGGRCRSYDDANLGCRIDNGNHLLLSGNTAALSFLETIGADGALTGPERAAFPFVDLDSGKRWTVAPGTGRIPWWIAVPSSRVPGTRLREYASILRLARATPGQTVADCIGGEGALFRLFWEPLTLAALNMSPHEGAASLLWAVVRETFLAGEAACRPLMARDCLNRAFIKPSVQFLTARGGQIRFHKRLGEITYKESRAETLRFADGETLVLTDKDTVIVAVPPASAALLIPNLRCPEGSRAIVNVHFRVEGLNGNTGIIGIVGGVCHWIFVRGDIVSVTISAADALAEFPSERIAHLTWSEVARILEHQNLPMAPYRVIKEKRATFAQSPANVRRRHGVETAWRNLFLAGDWTDTGLPATIEGSIRSGRTAADAVQHCTSCT